MGEKYKSSNHVSSNKDKYHDSNNTFSNKIKDAKETIGGKVNESKRTLESYFTELKKYINENPITSLGIALLAGILVSNIINR